MNVPVPGGYGGRASSDSAAGRRGGFWSNFPTYEDLMRADRLGGAQPELSGERRGLRFLKAFEEKNLLVPVVGNFAGPKALRAVGRYIREHGERRDRLLCVNVEQYLFQDGIWADFYRNVATLPARRLEHVHPLRVEPDGVHRGRCSGPTAARRVLDPMRASIRDFLAGRDPAVTTT